MRVLHLKRLFSASHLPKALILSRQSSFTVSLTVKSIDSIEIEADKTFGPNRKVSVQVYDSLGKLQDGSLLNAVHREDGFYMNYNRSEDDKLIVRLPLTTKLNECDVRVQGEKADVTVGNLILNSLKVDMQQGNVSASAVRLNNVEVTTANDIKMEGIFSPNLDKIHLNSTNGTVEVSECRCSELLAVGKIVRVLNCFNSLNKIRSSFELLIQNLLGCTTIETLGEKCEISGIAGTLNGIIGSRLNRIELIMLHQHDNAITFNHPESKSFLSLSGRMASQLSRILIDAKPEIITQSDDDIVLDRVGESSFEIVREKNSEAESTLKVKVIDGKELELHKQSWLKNFPWLKKLIFG